MFKRSLLFVAMIAAVAASAQAATRYLPADNVPHTCYYYTNDGYYLGQGQSRFDVNWSVSNNDIQRGIEYWSFNGRSDNRRFTFAKPYDDPNNGFTNWEFTALYDHQCKFAQAMGFAIFFWECSNGQTRDCWENGN